MKKDNEEHLIEDDKMYFLQYLVADIELKATNLEENALNEQILQHKMNKDVEVYRAHFFLPFKGLGVPEGHGIYIYDHTNIKIHEHHKWPYPLPEPDFLKVSPAIQKDFLPSNTLLFTKNKNREKKNTKKRRQAKPNQQASSKKITNLNTDIIPECISTSASTKSETNQDHLCLSKHKASSSAITNQKDALVEVKTTMIDRVTTQQQGKIKEPIDEKTVNLANHEGEKEIGKQNASVTTKRGNSPQENILSKLTEKPSEEEIGDLEKKIPENEKDAAETEKEVAETEKEVAETEKKTVETEKDVAKTEKKIVGNEKDAAETEKEIAATEKDAAETEKEILENEKDAAETEKEVAETEKEVAKTEKEPAETEKEVAETEKEPAETEKEVAKTEKEPAETEKESALVFEKHCPLPRWIRTFHNQVEWNPFPAQKLTNTKHQKIVDNLFDPKKQCKVTYKKFKTVFEAGGGKIIEGHGSHKILEDPTGKTIPGTDVFGHRNGQTYGKGFIKNLQIAVLYIGLRPS